MSCMCHNTNIISKHGHQTIFYMSTFLRIWWIGIKNKNKKMHQILSVILSFSKYNNALMITITMYGYK